MMLRLAAKKAGGHRSRMRSVLSLFGIGLDGSASKIKKMVLGCRASSPIGELESSASEGKHGLPIKRRARSDLSAQELDNIKAANLDRPLPGGWYFDGRRFLDFRGIGQKYHPDMDSFIEEFLDSEAAGAKTAGAK
jgi:hypothetical protein